MSRIGAILRSLRRGPSRSHSDGDQDDLLSVGRIGRLLDAEVLASTTSEVTATQASWLIDKLPPGCIAVMMDGIDWPPKVYSLSHQEKYTPDEFVQKAAASGSVGVLTSRDVTTRPIPVLKVSNSREAPWAIAADVRAHYDGEVIGITGTVGKSTTKGMLHHILAEFAKVVATPRNWNTIDGIAQTVTALVQQPDFAILESTIHCFIDKHEPTSRRVIQPTVGVVTAIGEAHRDVASTIQRTAEIKGRLLASIRPGGLAVISRDAAFYDVLHESAVQGAPREVVTFGADVESDYRLVDWRLEDGGARVKAFLRGEKCEYWLGTPGRAFALNSLAALAVVDGLGRSVEKAIRSLESYRPDQNVSTMFTLRLSEGSAVLIDDSTNATYLSMVAAFELLAKVHSERSGKRVAIRGQINFLGRAAHDIHASLAEPLLNSGVDAVVTVGRGMHKLAEALGPSVHLGHAASPEEAAELGWNILESGDAVLVKGASINTGFRQVGRRLRQWGAAR